MDIKELQDLMYSLDKKQGNFKYTQHEEFKEKRLKRLEKFTPTTIAFIEYLKQWNVPFHLCEVLHSRRQKHRITTDIFIPNANIVIRQVNVEDEKDVQKANSYFEAMKKNYYPFFIRSNETYEFILEKFNNCLIKADKKPMEGFAKVKIIKPKRPRITAKRVQPITRKKQYGK